MTAPSPAAVRMRRTRERRRHGDAIVSLELRPKVTADLVGLCWLPAPDRGDKDAFTGTLIKLIERAIEVRVTPAPARRAKSASCSKSSAARSTRWSTSGGCQLISRTISAQSLKPSAALPAERSPLRATVGSIDGTFVTALNPREPRPV